VTPSPAVSSKPVPKRVAERVSRGFLKWARRLHDTGVRARDEHDVEAIHDLRVATRRLSEMLWLWKPMLRASGAGALRRRLRRLRRDLGPVREAEVHLALVRRLRLTAGDPAKAARATLIEQLERRRRMARHAAALRMAPDDIDRWLEGMAGESDLRAGRPRVVARVEARLGRLRSRALATLGAARTANDPERLHVARVALKRWRYAQESLGEVLGRPSEPELAELQETLGVVHDFALLDELLASPEEGAGEPWVELRRRVTRRLDLRKAAAARVIAAWLERRKAPVPGVPAKPPAPDDYRRTTRNGGAPPSPASRPRGVRSRRPPATAGG